MAKHILPSTKNIASVSLIIGRIVITLKSGRTRSYRYEQLTPKQETKLRALAGPLPVRREAPRSRETGHPRKRTNYAALVSGRSILVTVNGVTTGMEV